MTSLWRALSSGAADVPPALAIASSSLFILAVGQRLLVLWQASRSAAGLVVPGIALFIAAGTLLLVPAVWSGGLRPTALALTLQLVSTIQYRVSVTDADGDKLDLHLGADYTATNFVFAAIVVSGIAVVIGSHRQRRRISMTQQFDQWPPAAGD